LVELDRLEVRKAPPSFAQSGFERDCVSVSGNAILKATDRLQHVAVAEPYTRLLRCALKHALVKPDRILEITEPAERRGLKIPVPDPVGLFGKNVIEQRHGFRRAARSAEHQRQVRSSRCPTWS